MPELLKDFDFLAGKFSCWGNGQTLFDITTTDDTTKYIAEAISNLQMANKGLELEVIVSV
ncbi:hypothetical protein [Chroococcidiopsis sp.]|uniref:hypothetical protein n=1 Tax=Chroococcidiopsis sp. TaxID=3088168 RepID=UPI003F2E9453